MERARIQPTEVAERLQTLREDGCHSRWIEEMLWFLQVADSQPQGLANIAHELLNKYPENLGPESLAGLINQPSLSKVQTAEFWKSVPLTETSRFRGVIPDLWVSESVDTLFDDDAEYRSKARQRERGLPETETMKLLPVLAGIAGKQIEARLLALCRERLGSQQLDSSWCFRGLSEALKNLLTMRAQTARGRIAQTSVVEQVFHALDYAWEQGVMVQIEGDPRHGKTEAIKTYCEMYPGRARLVTVPCETTDADFFVAVAEALQIPVGGPSCNIGDLRRTIDYVLKNARLLIIFDEAHFLVPQRYSETTPPTRMNWVRTRVADRGLPAALMITPQSFDEAFRKFVRKTKYRFDQFLGRTAHFKLPSQLTESDVIAVAQNHFPDIKLPYLKLIASKAMQSSGYLQAVEFTARYARFLASRPDRDGKITGDDVRQAITKMMPFKPVAKASTTPDSVAATDIPSEPDILKISREEQPTTTVLERHGRLEPGVLVA